MSKKLSISTFYYIIAVGLSKAIGVILLPIFSAEFDPIDFGKVDLIVTVTSFLTYLGMIQLESALSRFYYEEEGENYKKKLVSTVFWVVFSSSLFLSILLYLFSDNVSLFLFETESYSALIDLSSVLIFLTNVYSLFSIIVRFEDKLKIFLFAVALQVATTILVSLYCLYTLSFGVETIFLGQIAGLVLAILYLFISFKALISFQFSKKLIQESFNYSLPLLPTILASWANSYANRFILISSVSLEEIGLLNVAVKIASLFTMLKEAFKMAWSPYLWKHIYDDNYKKLFKGLNQKISLAVFFILLVSILFSDQIILLISNEKYLSASKLLILIFISYGLNIIVQTVLLGPSIVKKTYYNTGIYFFSVLINLGTLYFFIPSYAILAAPLAMLASSLAVVITSWYFSEKLYHIGFSKKSFIIPFFIVLLVAFLKLNQSL